MGAQASCDGRGWPLIQLRCKEPSHESTTGKQKNTIPKDEIIVLRFCDPLS